MKKLLAFAVAILMAAPAFASVQNVKVSGNITSSYVNRQDFDFVGSQFRQSVFLTQATLRVDADLSDNVSTTVAFINERAWGAEPTSQTFTDASSTEVQLYLAYATLREFLYSPLTVTVGRQVFAFGNSLVFDATGTNNAATGPLGTIARDLTVRSSLDAIRATFDYKPLTVDIFYGKASQGVVLGRTTTHKDDSDVYGINANYQLGDERNSVVEAYVFGRTNGSNLNSAPQSDRADKIWVPGLRASTNPLKGLNVQVEGALQRGESSTLGSGFGSGKKKSAYAIQTIGSYALQVAELEKYKPTVKASYTYLSGDKDSSNSKNSMWDPMFENQGGGTIYNSIFNLTNMQIINVTLSASPLADVTASLSWNNLVAASPVAVTGLSLTEPDGSAAPGTLTTDKKHNNLGNEYDAALSYAYTEDVTFGLNLGLFVPGNAFTQANNQNVKQAIASVGVNF